MKPSIARAPVCGTFVVAVCILSRAPTAHAQTTAPADPPGEAAAQDDTEEPSPPQPPLVLRRWRKDQPVPPGYHPEQRHRLWPLLVGIPTFVGFYVGTMALAHSSTESAAGWGYVPIVGPLVWATQQPNDEFSGLTALFLFCLSAVQAGGAALVTVGIVSRKTVLVRDAPPAPSALVTPLFLGRSGTGIGLAGTF